MRRDGLSVAVIGGGIGGLTAGLSLLKAGLDVHVYEQSSRISEVGAGIAVSPNATRILYRLGLEHELARTGVRPTAWWQRRWDDGRTLSRTPLGAEIEKRFSFPHYQMHRGDLVAALARALPATRLHTGHRLSSLVDHGDTVQARFDNGETTRADVLIGADGIHSAVRAALFGPETPHFTGCVAYRGVIPAARLAHLDMEPAIQIWMGPNSHFIHYDVSGLRLVNVVAVIEQDTWTKESWTEPGDVADLLAAHDHWHPQVRAILHAFDETFRWAIFERSPMPRWSRGRVTLLGDACHAMLPFLAQGAAQAMEDGVTLAALLSNLGSPASVPDALGVYESVRRPRVTRVQRMASDNKTRLHLPDGPAQQARDAQLASGTTDIFFSAWEWLYRHDPEAALTQTHRTILHRNRNRDPA
jgi:salicylate hydroxylase